MWAGKVRYAATMANAGAAASSRCVLKGVCPVAGCTAQSVSVGSTVV